VPSDVLAAKGGLKNRKECPICHSIYTRKSGRLDSGKQRYHCSNCNKRFILEYSKSYTLIAKAVMKHTPIQSAPINE
jgi:transposase-like protein